MGNSYKENLKNYKETVQSPAKEENSAPKTKKKNTKRWCRGVVGREHSLKCYQRSLFTGTTPHYEYACEHCGKVLDTYYPHSLVGNKLRPDWVIEIE